MSLSVRCDGCGKLGNSLGDLQSWKYYEKLKNVFCTDVCYADQQDKKKGCVMLFGQAEIAAVKGNNKIHNIFRADENTQITFTVLAADKKMHNTKNTKDESLLYPTSTQVILVSGGTLEVLLYDHDDKPYASPVLVGFANVDKHIMIVIPPNTKHRLQSQKGSATTFSTTFSPPALSEDDVFVEK